MDVEVEVELGALLLYTEEGPARKPAGGPVIRGAAAIRGAAGVTGRIERSDKGNGLDMCCAPKGPTEDDAGDPA